MHYIVEQLDADGDGWPEGLGNVERPGMGEEKLDNTVYTIRGLRDLADMAAPQGRRATARVGARHARDAWRPRSRRPGGCRSVPRLRRLARRPRQRPEVYQRHWIGVTPMEAELVDATASVEPGARRARPRRTRARRARAALLRRRLRPVPHRHARLRRRPAPGTGREADVHAEHRRSWRWARATTAGSAPSQQQRYTTANRRLQLPDPDEQPGAMPEIAPSPRLRAQHRQAVHRAAPWCSRPGARTGRCGRSCTSSSACARTSAAAPARGRAAGAAGPVADRRARTSASAGRRAST